MTIKNKFHSESLSFTFLTDYLVPLLKRCQGCISLYFQSETKFLEKITPYAFISSSVALNSRSMKKLLITCCIAAAGVTSAHAAPQNDELDKFLTKHNSVLTQLQQASDSVRSSTSDLIGQAMAFLGVNYRYGGTSAETGFDCSGFVRATFEKARGYVLPRRAADQAAATTTIAKEELKPGDLVFFNTMRRAFSHVGIYIGEGKFIHAPRSGSSVRVDDMHSSYWTSRFNGARRVAGDGNKLSTADMQALSASTR